MFDEIFRKYWDGVLRCPCKKSWSIDANIYIYIHVIKWKVIYLNDNTTTEKMMSEKKQW